MLVSFFSHSSNLLLTMASRSHTRLSDELTRCTYLRDDSMALPIHNI